jgi:hypothetical protein
MENVPNIEEKMQELVALHNLSRMFLKREEYAVFIDLVERIKNRAENAANNLDEVDTEEKTTLKYSYDIEVEISYKTYRNNQKGERVATEDYVVKNFLFKIPLGEEPKDKISQINQSVLENI